MPLTLTTLNNKQSAIADNQDSITVVANLTDAYHNPLKNIPVYWQSSINHIDETTTQTDEKRQNASCHFRNQSTANNNYRLFIK